MSDAPRLGHHQHFDEQDYHDVDAVSSGRLRDMANCGAAVQLSLEPREKIPTSWLLGSATHCAVLEPATWQHRYQIAAIDGRAKKADKQLIEDLKADGIDALTPDEGERVRGMVKSVTSNPRIASLLEIATAAEESTFWMRDGHLCKSRKDLVGDGWLADLKTCADFHRFNYDITSRRYYIQAAHYADGDRRHGRAVSHWFWLVVQSTPPYLSGVKRLRDVDWQAATDEMEMRLEQYIGCKRANVWSQHVADIEDVGMSKWRYSEIYPEEG